MDRKLASIQKITAINPIPGADKIEVANVLGWECVIAKSDGFKVNDLVVYIEIDSIVPEKLLKLINMWDNQKNKGTLSGSAGNRLKTRKFKGQISQGLIMPIKILEYYK